MWSWLRVALSKFSLVTMLREQLALCKAQSAKFERENADFKAQITVLQAELKIERQGHQQTQAEYQMFKDEHAEDVFIYRTVEFRRGHRTGKQWVAFCPKCHLPIAFALHSYGVECSGHCGWTSEMDAKEIRASLHELEDLATKSK